jgi:kynurenine formamidase
MPLGTKWSISNLTDEPPSRVIDLSHAYEVGMPQSSNHPPFRMTLERRHGDMIRPDGGSAANELLVLGGHVGTHIDALVHVSQDGRLFGGLTPVEAGQRERGFARLGIDEFAPYVGRGVLLDVAATLSVACLPPGYEVTATDLRAAQERANVAISPGDVVLIGTGWATHWKDPAIFGGQASGAPGPGIDAARWLASLAPRAVGAETIAFEQIPASRGHSLLPVHRIMLVEHGINIVEAMDLTELRQVGVAEFVLVLNPLKIKGATGAPVRPLAIVR